MISTYINIYFYYKLMWVLGYRIYVKTKLYRYCLLLPCQPYQLMLPRKPFLFRIWKINFTKFQAPLLNTQHFPILPSGGIRKETVESLHSLYCKSTLCLEVIFYCPTNTQGYIVDNRHAKIHIYIHLAFITAGP